MRTIFISPLLWQRFNRAVRRREEGQALVLIALAAVALVAVVGLAVDGGMNFLEAQRLQRAADTAALSGVIWMPNSPDVADYRGRVAAESLGYNVYELGGSNNGTQLPANGYTQTQVETNPPGTFTRYESQNPKPKLISQYRVTLTTKVSRYFLGVIGFGDYIITRSALADYATPARLGGSFNYYGTSSLPYDWTVPYRKSSDPYYSTLYDRFFASNCQKEGGANNPSPCVGTFWVNIQGPHSYHSNGDAYTPIGDGQTGTDPGGAYGGVYVNTGFPNTGCSPTIDPGSWNFSVSGCASGSPPSINQDTSPNSNGVRGFGYEIAIQTDKRALVDNDAGNPQGLEHTRLNIYVYDAAMADKGDNPETFNTGDSYQAYGGGAWPQSTPPGSNVTRNGYSPMNFLPATGDFTQGGARKVYNSTNSNGAMTRFSLYYPPSAQGLPTTWQTKGDLIASFTTSDASLRRKGLGSPASDNAPPVNGDGGSYCYIAVTLTGGVPPKPVVNGDATTIDASIPVIYTCPLGAGGQTPLSNTNTDSDYRSAATGKSFTINYPATGLPNGFPGVPPTGTEQQYSALDPAQECRNYFDPFAYDTANDFNKGDNNQPANSNVGGNPRKSPRQQQFTNNRIPTNMRGIEPNINIIAVAPQDVNRIKYISYRGWRCNWDFDSSTNPFMSGRGNGTGVDPSEPNEARSAAEGIKAQPFFHLSNYGWVGGSKTKITYKNGVKSPAAGSDPPVVRDGVYLLHVQSFGGQFSNRFAIKTEYERAQPIVYSFGAINPQP